ncbi:MULTISPECIES: response regulator transcription factor [Paraburkholderia]|uniref:response regulator transcription factor n=1 Tax=Paraburkholderia TaxID=1822464 RepID=UPI002257FF64|nr:MULTISPECIES: response regulator transcription factor [Paraburkholderia]MCX4160883.1 response regulator transcription factor [Paraburkholderia megapolitana]MDN7156379.1 response regulator transcription factor [Paraburkholderia sp. CHISQ3]MDQ6493424.1 response regulator transcription factor [Paraburkholderia megapolitana]
MRVLVVEDDPVHAKAAVRVVGPLGHDIIEAGDGEEAVRLLRSQPVDLVILDWLLPRMSGFEVLYWIRRNLGDVPAVLFLTNKVLDDDIVLAMEAGADDYLVKPFRVGELTARVNALLRRVTHDLERTDHIRAGDYTLDPLGRTVALRGERIDLTPKEFDLTALFFNNLGKLLSRKVVSISTWGRELDPASRTLDTHVYRVRQKLALAPENGLRLSAVYTHGYRLEEVPSKSPRSAVSDQNVLPCN